MTLSIVVCENCYDTVFCPISHEEFIDSMQDDLKDPHSILNNSKQIPKLLCKKCTYVSYVFYGHIFHNSAVAIS